MSEPLSGLLAELPSAELDPLRDERIRARCRARLARMHASVSRAPESPMKITQVWQALIAGLGAAYLAEVIVQALRVAFVP
jgi:hypothetical protein